MGGHSDLGRVVIEELHEEAALTRHLRKQRVMSCRDLREEYSFW